MKFDEKKIITGLTCGVTFVAIAVLIYIFTKYGIDPNHNFGFPIF